MRFFCYLLVLICYCANAQTDSLRLQPRAGLTLTDTVAVPKSKHSPKRATLYSAILPGLGQAYNRQYWKIPIVAASAGALVYAISYTNERYKFYQNRLFLINNYPDQFPAQTLEAQRQTTLLNLDNFRRYRDLNIILSCVAYTLIVADANVYAHLKDFDLNDDLSLRVRPLLIPASALAAPAVGLSLTLNLK